MKIFWLSSFGLALMLLSSSYATSKESIELKFKGKVYSPKLLSSKKTDVKIWALDIPVKKGISQRLYLIQAGEFFFNKPYVYDPDNKTLVPESTYMAHYLLDDEQVKRIEAIADKLRKKGFLIKDLNKSKENLYVFVDPLCKYCEREFNKGLIKQLEKKYNVVVIPYPVHGEKSIRIIANLFHHIKNDKSSRGLTEAFQEFFQNEKELRVLSSLDIASKEEKDAVKEIYETLKDIGIPGTPSYLIGNKLYLGKFPKHLLKNIKEKGGKERLYSN